jgi:hypothetical protein
VHTGRTPFWTLQNQVRGLGRPDHHPTTRKPPLMKRILLTCLVCSLVMTHAAAQKTEFSKDSAYANLNVLVNIIGPRPMGSPAEGRALQFAVSRFRQYGCQEAYVMPMTDAAGVNTKSGIAVGVLRGKTGRIIIIGGHIDSQGPEVPGANDDGSGAASVIELARVICKKEHESTVVFCCWGGEEEGLRGSEYFAAHYRDTNDVALMLQIDMADGSGNLDADPDGAYQVSAPRWLVDAAFDIFYNDLHSEGLVYPTQSATVNSSSGGGTGSDHMPFLAKGIPAIDFTSDVSYPIHTPLDNWANFNPAGLPRTGDLVLRLFERFDGGTPSRSTEKYWLFIVGNTPVFFSHPLLRGVAALAFLLGLAVLFIVRKRHPAPAPGLRVRWSGLKLLLFALIIQAFMWLSENVIGIVRGYRFPWVNNYGGFVVLAVFCGLIGLWLSLRMVRRLPLSGDPFPYYLRAFILLCVLIVLLSLPNAELAVYPALSLIFLSLALLLPHPVLKGALLILTPYPVVRLVFSEYTGLFQRLLAHEHMPTFFSSVLYNAGFVLFFTLASLPYVYAFGAVYRDSARDLFWLKKFRGTAGLAVACCGAVATAVILIFRPVYDPLWETSVSVTQIYRLGADSGAVNLSSGEYLRGVRCVYDGRDSTLDARVTSVRLPTERPAVVSWLTVDTSVTRLPGGGDTASVFERRLVLHSALRPLIVTVSYRSEMPFTAASPWISGVRRGAVGDAAKNKTFTWYAFPDTPLVVPVTFTLRDSQKVRENVEVTYDSIAYPLALGRDMTYFVKRTIVDAGAIFGAPQERKQ